MSIFTKVLTKIFGKKSDRDLTQLMPNIEKINTIYDTFNSLTDQELKDKFLNHRTILTEIRDKQREDGLEKELKESKLDEFIYQAEQSYLNDISHEVFAIIKDASRRLVGTTFKVMDHNMEWNMVHFDVQLIGGIVLHQGKIAEMKTGEGKTLVSTLSIALNALNGRGVHVITVNDYLAERDSQWMGLIFEWLGLSVGCILNQMPPAERREMYLKDITYGTNSEFGFDYLRDNMAITKDNQVQRGHVYAIVDEVDSVLIDEARTPLIISGQVDAPTNMQYQEHNAMINNLVRKQTALVNTLLAEAEKILDSDKDKAGLLILQSHRGMPKNKRLMKLFQQQGIQQLMRTVEGDFIREKKLNTVDEILYFAVDERANIIDLTELGRQTLSPSNPEAFVIPDIGEEFHDIDVNTDLTDTEKLSKREEIQAVHAERSDRIHAINQLLKSYTLFEKDIDYIVQNGKVLIVDEHTGRVMHGRRFSDGLHQSLEAKESVVIEKETQTMATITIQNYFRMYEKLAGMTGTASTEAPEFMQTYSLDVVEIPTNVTIIRKDQEDYIYKTKREKYNATVLQIEKLFRKGQPVLVGTTSVEESETLARMLKRTKIPHNVLNAKQHQKEADVIERAGHRSGVTIATNMAGRGTDIKLSDEIKEFGGLYILGTGRHESRRIDLQLRGRAGRQGDPGETIFYLSLEDDLMRLFGSDRISKIMDKMGIEEGEVITHSMVSKSIGRAQKKVEERNYAIRKHLLEYDDVMNQQRIIVYDRRNYALHGENFASEMNEIIGEYIDVLISMYCENPDSTTHWDWTGLNEDILSTLAVDIKQDELEINNAQELKDSLTQVANLVLTNKIKLVDEKVFEDFEKYVVLRTIDEKWREHLYAMDQLREGINLRAYGQKNPLIEYKREGFGMFAEMMGDTNRETLKRIFRARINTVEEKPAQQQNTPRNLKVEHSDASGMGFVAAPQQQGQPSQPGGRQKVQPIHVEEKVGRNDPCPCKSGKKYKKCCGVN
jgi:preprotein translocase subunit SecA